MKIAIIGFGGRIANVFQNLKNVAGDRISLVGWADPMATPIGLGTVPVAGQGFTDHREMLRVLKPDAVMVGSPNHLHLEHITDALEAGCKVFSEKPVVITPEESWAAAELLRKHGENRFVVGLVLRSSPLFRSAMAYLRSGELGTPVSMEANEHLHPEHGGYIARNWRRYRKYSGSHLLEKCCHDIDLLQAVLGGRVLKAASFGGRSVFTPANSAQDAPDRYRAWRQGWEDTSEGPFTADGDVLDHQVCIAEMEGGSRLTFHVNNHSISQRRWLLCGTKGVWESDFATGRIRTQDAFGKPVETVPDNASHGGHYGADQAMAQDLFATWFEGKPFPVPTRAAIEAGLAAMGMDQAQREGRIVDLAPWWKKLDGILGSRQVATGSAAT